MSVLRTGIVGAPVASDRSWPLERRQLLLLVLLALAVFVVCFGLGRLTRPSSSGSAAPTAAALKVDPVAVAIPRRLAAVPPIPSLAAPAQVEVAAAPVAHVAPETHAPAATSSPTTVGPAFATTAPISTSSPTLAKAAPAPPVAPAPKPAPTRSPASSRGSSSTGHSSGGGSSAGGSFDSSG
jgi:uncharacterized membrane protein YgcG